MSDEIFFEGKKYIPTNDAATQYRLSRDYISKLCRKGKIGGRHVEKKWYVDGDSLAAYQARKAEEYAQWRERHAQRLALEYRSSRGDLTLPEASERSGLSENHIRKLWRDDSIKGTTREGDLYIPPESLGALSSRRDYEFAAAGKATFRKIRAAKTSSAQLSPMQLDFMPDLAQRTIALGISVFVACGVYTLANPSALAFAADSAIYAGKQVAKLNMAASLRNAEETVAKAVESPAQSLAEAGQSIEGTPDRIEDLLADLRASIGGAIQLTEQERATVQVEIETYSRRTNGR